MEYEYAIRPYDRTPEGNIPSFDEFDADTDLQAMCYAFDYVDPDEASNDEELIDILVEEGWLEEKCSSKEAIEILCDRENRTLDASDAFTFYVKNLTTGEMVYENDYCSIEDWTESLEGNVEEFRRDVLVDLADLAGIPLAVYFIDKVIELKKDWWGNEGTYEDFLYEEGDNFKDPILKFVFYLFYEDNVSIAFEETGIEDEDSLNDFIEKVTKEVPLFDKADEWMEVLQEELDDMRG